MAINIDSNGFDESLKKVFQEGVALDSPSATFSYNTDPKSKAKSSLTMNFKIQGPHISEGYVSNADINQVKQLAYNFITSNGLRYFNLTGDVYTQVSLDSLTVTPVAGTDIWDVAAKYVSGPTDSGLEIYFANFSFSTSASTAHITQSFETMAVHSADGSGETFDFYGGIGYQDGEWQGVDVMRPALRFTKDIWIAEHLLTFGVMRNFASVTGTVNADRFCGFEPGEVLFKGIANSARSKISAGNLTVYYWALTLEFECQPNGNWGPEGIYKNGWDYFWTLYETNVITSDDGSRKTIKRPVQYNIERVYPYVYFCDFFGFGYEDGYISGTGQTPFDLIRRAE